MRGTSLTVLIVAAVSATAAALTTGSGISQRPRAPSILSKRRHMPPPAASDDRTPGNYTVQIPPCVPHDARTVDDTISVMRGWIQQAINSLAQTQGKDKYGYSIYFGATDYRDVIDLLQDIYDGTPMPIHADGSEGSPSFACLNGSPANNNAMASVCQDENAVIPPIPEDGNTTVCATWFALPQTPEMSFPFLYCPLNSTWSSLGMSGGSNLGNFQVHQLMYALAEWYLWFGGDGPRKVPTKDCSPSNWPTGTDQERREDPHNYACYISSVAMKCDLSNGIAVQESQDSGRHTELKKLEVDPEMND